MKTFLHPCVTSVSHFVAALGAIVILLFASSQAFAFGITNVTVSPGGSVSVLCGSTITITVTVNYRVDAWDWLPITETVELNQRNFLFDDKVGNAYFTVPSGTTSGNYSSTSTITLYCSPVQNGLCSLSGNFGIASGGNPHNLFSADVFSARFVEVCRVPALAYGYGTQSNMESRYGEVGSVLSGFDVAGHVEGFPDNETGIAQQFSGLATVCRIDEKLQC